MLRPVIAVGALALVAACGSQGSTTSANASPKSLTPSPQPTALSQTATAIPSQSPASPAPSRAAASGSRPLTGLGATDAVWSAHHIADLNYATGAAYDALPGTSGDTQFSAVRHVDGVIVSFLENFPSGTTIRVAQLEVAAVLPTDVRVLYDHVEAGNECRVVELSSAELAGNPASASGLIALEYSSGEAADHYDGTDVTQAIVEDGTGLTTDPGGC